MYALLLFLGVYIDIFLKYNAKLMATNIIALLLEDTMFIKLYGMRLYGR